MAAAGQGPHTRSRRSSSRAKAPASIGATRTLDDSSRSSRRGPSFELFYESDYLLPHRRAAWALIRERLQEAVLFCTRIHADTRVTESIAAVGAALKRFADRLVLEEVTR